MLRVRIPGGAQHLDELEAYEQLRNTLVPTWIEFNVDPEHPLRCRLAWEGRSFGLASLDAPVAACARRKKPWS
ncbi:hypothetical protein [Thermomonas sp.]|uniref:hypothetical protein n=1 Tax=Thermomonas sp. TaxID=1971895 RepID=UPI00261EF21F|nr:hypothetical protein [Thermomonas sp.]MCO5056135.1 DUF1631 domain-containing protein [Thermomonas sp.]